MKRITILLAAVVTIFSGCSKTETNPILEIEGGKVQGIASETEGVTVYRGIPYAAAPVGELRWKAPQPVTAWEGVKIADTWGAPSMQNKHRPEEVYTPEFFFDGDPEFSEDCLYLNVWAPTKTLGKTDTKLPVAMWVHGGGYTAGWGFEPEMDGEAWAERGVILVTINYRLGIFGFLTHPFLSAENENGVSGNYGTLDQVAALKWVYNNIAQFGGDPENITIFGQSAGAMSIKNLVTTSLTGNMVKKAIIQSGGGISGRAIIGGADLQAGMEANKAIFDWGGYDTLEKMRAASTEEIFTLASRYAQETGTYARLTSSPVVDGYVTSESFDDAALAGRIKDIPYMIGFTMNDMGALGAGIEKFCEVREAAGKPAYAYEFARPLPDSEENPHPLKGAFHSSELWYIFHTLSRSDRPFTDVDDVLSNQMVDAWTNFAKYGNPNGADGEQIWTPMTSDSKKYMVFKLNDDCSAVASEMLEEPVL